MTLRNLVALLTVFAVVSIGLWTATLNTDQVTFTAPGFPPHEFQTSLWVVGFLAILLGVLGTLLYTVVLSSKAAFSRWRRTRNDLKTAGDTELIQSGLAAAVRGDHAAALQRFETVLENDPERLDAWIQGGNAARAMGDLDTAVDMHIRARGLAPDDADVHDALARDFEVLGECARAVGHLEQRLVAEPKGDPELFARMRDLLARQGRWDEALEAQDKRVKLLKDAASRADEEAVNRGLRFEQGRALFEQGGKDPRQEALAIFTALRKEDPQFVPAYLLQGRARNADGDVDGAVEAWTEGVVATHALELLNELVSHYFNAGDPEQAIRTFRQSAESIGGDEGRAARLGLALLYARLEMLEEAREELERLEDEVEFSPTVAYHLAKLSARQGDSATAADRFRQVIQASNILEPCYRCGHCGTAHDAYVMHCAECGRWGTVVIDTSEELRPVSDRKVKAPRP
jgi:tetratricopeptide (TPR) repeat protein